MSPPTVSGNLVGFHELHSQRSYLSDERTFSSVAGSFQTSDPVGDQSLILSPRGGGDPAIDQFVGH